MRWLKIWTWNHFYWTLGWLFNYNILFKISVFSGNVHEESLEKSGVDLCSLLLFRHFHAFVNLTVSWILLKRYVILRTAPNKRIPSKIEDRASNRWMYNIPSPFSWHQFGLIALLNTKDKPISISPEGNFLFDFFFHKLHR